ncbi:peptide deformylase [Shewanella donghaensis]|uniref:peptide deformylase n=1 Tax=Shewanella donghaensis TaxID=238836 RepID=UPI0011821B81|nr:peptide deformylase [Shewanella donghaensis]
MPDSNIMTIAQTGEAILACQAKPVVTFDQALVKLTEDMMATMFAANGVGLAATQVFSDKAVFIMYSRPNERYPSAPNTVPTIVINPKITARSLAMESSIEGCLSIENERVAVFRHQHIKVMYQTLAGDVVEQQLSGFIARIFQHEFDHLQGITLLERMNMPDQVSALEQHNSGLQDVC